MLNLTLVQKHLSVFRNVHHMGYKNIYLQSCASTSKENQMQQRSHWKWRLSSHLPLDHVDGGEISPTQFYFWHKTGYGIGLRYFLSFETENWICWLLRHYLNFWCELYFIGQQIFNVSPWTRNCPNLYTCYGTIEP